MRGDAWPAGLSMAKVRPKVILAHKSGQAVTYAWWLQYSVPQLNHRARLDLERAGRDYGSRQRADDHVQRQSVLIRQALEQWRNGVSWWTENWIKEWEAEHGGVTK